MIHEDAAAAFPRDARQFRGFGRRGAQRLLDEHVLAGQHRLLGQVEVGRYRRRDRDEIHVRVRADRVELGGALHLRMAARRELEPLVRAVANDGYGRAVVLRELRTKFGPQ